MFLVFFFRVFYSAFLRVSKRFRCDAFDWASIFSLSSGWRNVRMYDTLL